MHQLSAFPSSFCYIVHFVLIVKGKLPYFVAPPQSAKDEDENSVDEADIGYEEGLTAAMTHDSRPSHGNDSDGDIVESTIYDGGTEQDDDSIATKLQNETELKVKTLFGCVRSALWQYDVVKQCFS